VINFLWCSDVLLGLDAVDSLLELVWKNDYWTPRIVDKKQYLLAKHHIKAMLLQPIATV
jgi:hypothetical protein